MSALLPCPLCASADVVAVIGAVEFTDAEVQCKECGAQTGNYYDGTTDENKAAAIAAWNLRAGDDELATLRAEVERLRGALEVVCAGVDTFAINPVGEGDIVVEGGSRFAHERDVVRLLATARAALAKEARHE